MRMEDIFFSGTFGGEALSLAAANAVLNKLKKESVIPHFWSLGKQLHDGLDKLIDAYGFNKIFNVSGCSVWSFFNIKDTSFASAYELKTLLLQEMFSQGILNLGVHNISYAHTKTMVQKLINGYDVFFAKVEECSRSGIDSLLKCESLEPLFKVR